MSLCGYPLFRLGPSDVLAGSATARVRTPLALDTDEEETDVALRPHTSARIRQCCVATDMIAPNRRRSLEKCDTRAADEPDRRARVKDVDRIAAVTGKTCPEKHSVIGRISEG